MKTAYIIFLSAFIIAMMFYIGKTTISFSPFKFSMQKPFDLVGFILIGVALGCFKYQSYSEGFDKGVDAATKNVKEQVEQIIKDRNNGNKIN